MIHDLDMTLEKLLLRELNNTFSELTITFATPDEQFPPQSVSLPAIDLFLYDIRENADLRSNEWTSTRTGSEISGMRPPVRVDCSYLVTAWPSVSQTKPAYDEHLLLGKVMCALLKYPFIPSELLSGELSINQTGKLPIVALNSGIVQSIGEFWQALGGKPKASLNFTVTIEVNPFTAVHSAAVTKPVITIVEKNSK